MLGSPVKQSKVVATAGVQKADLGAVIRIRSQDLFQQNREIEIEHDGRIYRLRMTQLNKLILTA